MAHDLSPGLLRQRRNLMISSAALVFLGLADAELHSVHLLGLEATFGNPDAVVYGLVIVTCYFLYRYFLYLLQESEPGLRFEYYRRLNEYAKPKIHSLRDRKYPEAEGLHLEEPLGVGRQGPFRWTILVPSGRDNMGGFETERMDVYLHQVLWESIKAAILTTVARSYFTDYIFPFIAAVFALVVGVKKYWL